MDSKIKNKKINELIKKIVSDNDLFSLSELMELKTPDISIIAFNILKDKNYAEDIVDEVMISLMKNIHKFKDYKNINGWINSVTINRSIDYLRKLKHEVIFNEDFFSESNNTTENSIIERLTIVSALESLEPLERNIFIDKYTNDMTLIEISKRYNITIKKVRVILEKSKNKFELFYKKEDK